MPNAFTLNPNPNWHNAAQELVNGLHVLNHSDERISLLETMCVRMGDSLYPAFLQILFTLEQCADAKSADIVASTLIDCIRLGRLPSGRLPAWGSFNESGDKAFGQTRILGPIEYACAWYAQGGITDPLPEKQFIQLVGSLIRLVNANGIAKDYYCQKLQADIDDSISGAFSTTTRNALQALIDTWQHQSARAPEAFTKALESQSLLDRIAEEPFR